MSDTLVVNPYLRLDPIGDGSTGFTLSAAKRNAGMSSIHILRDDNSGLFDLFNELSKTRFDFLDVDNDLSQNDREFLSEHGILVDKGDVPALPSFACMLDSVEPFAGELHPELLFVNSSFRFEPFDLANFAATLHQKHLSPYLPSAWIRSPVTEIEFGYWLSPEIAKIVAEFKAGAVIDAELDAPTLRKLIGAKIVTSEDISAKDAFDAEMAVEAAKSSFAKDGYAVFEKLVPRHQVSAMQAFYRKYVAEGFMPFGDTQVPGRYQQHDEPLASFLHRDLVRLMSLVVGSPVRASYVYAASYVEGAILHPHTDREQCEFSISFQVDYHPEPPNDVSPWTLYVEPLVHDGPLPEQGVGKSWDDVDMQAAAAVHLANGDGLFYKGRELVHYRTELPAGHRSTSLFFHFVPADFAGSTN